MRLSACRIISSEDPSLTRRVTITEKTWEEFGDIVLKSRAVTLLTWSMSEMSLDLLHLFRDMSFAFMDPGLPKRGHSLENVARRRCHFPLNLGRKLSLRWPCLRHDDHVAHLQNYAKTKLRFRGVNGYAAADGMPGTQFFKDYQRMRLTLRGGEAKLVDSENWMAK